MHGLPNSKSFQGEELRTTLNRSHCSPYNQPTKEHALHQHILHHPANTAHKQEKINHSLQSPSNLLPYSPASASPTFPGTTNNLTVSLQSKPQQSPIPPVPPPLVGYPCQNVVPIRPVGINSSTKEQIQEVIKLYVPPTQQLQFSNVDNKHAQNDKLFHNSETFFSPPPMFSNTPPPADFSNNDLEIAMEVESFPKFPASMPRNKQSKKLFELESQSKNDTREYVRAEIPPTSTQRNVKLKSTISTIQLSNVNTKSLEENKESSV